MMDRGRAASPLYVQVHRLLAAQIAAGQYAPGAALPSEPGLAQELGVSRATIIKAFDSMEGEGLIVRRQGKGTYVAPTPRRRSLTELTSFTAVTAAGGAAPGQTWIAFEPVRVGEARDELAAAFPVTQELVRLERVRFSDGIPVGFHTAILPADVLTRAGVTQASADQPGFSLYAALEAIGSQPESAEESLRAVVCPDRVAHLLGVAPGTPMMQVRRRSRDQTGALIEAVDAFYVGSLYEYHTQLVSQPSKVEERSDHEDIHERHRGRSVRVVVDQRVRGRGARV